ncbi:MAG: 7-carboxy-7-deazaguanine synthase QueE [Epsilonproteobacteria bacterium]|nr:7-carboxy-7-deazaguanine synthase QueE [Campylobacterota bacterium]
MIYLVESFYSFQGEGKYAGTPSIFIRLGGCNLKCEGFQSTAISPIDGKKLKGCDSIRAVNRKHFSFLWEKITSPSALIAKIENLIPKNCKPDIVVTGGEPLLYYKERELIETLKYFLTKKHKITIETNATIFVNFKKYPLYKDIVFAMSVKLSNSGESYEKRVNKKAIDSIIKNTKDSFFKFVLDKELISSKKAEREIEDIIISYNNPTVFCMPMGSNAKEVEKNAPAVAEFCIKKCYFYMDRLHIRLWNNEEKR